jgi:hypothetical protein
MLKYKLTNKFQNKNIYFKTIEEGSYAGSEILFKRITIPFAQQTKNTGYSNLIQNLIREQKDKVVNPMEDVEKIKFNSASGGTQTKIGLELEFFFYNVESGSYGNNYTSAGFTEEEVSEKRNNIKNSFYRVDFYDSNNQREQNFLFSEFLNVNQKTSSTKFKLDRLYWFKEDSKFINEENPTYRELYMEVTFFNAKNGLTTKFLNTTLSGSINLDTYNGNPNWRFGKIRLLNPYFDEENIGSKNRLFYVDTSINANTDASMSFYETKII